MNGGTFNICQYKTFTYQFSCELSQPLGFIFFLFMWSLHKVGNMYV